jgi:hypothetical protein
MGAMVSGRCQIKGLLTRCGAPAIGFCQYCGRYFCADHGALLEEHQEVCHRKPCVAKREDVARHLVYRAQVYQRNTTRLCGVFECKDAPASQCSRCLGYYCSRHTEMREDTPTVNGVPISRRVSLCHHCWLRRPIWQRR